MAGTTVYAANKASKTAKDAAATQTDYGNRALDLQRQMYETQRADEQPYRQMGYGALNTLSSMMGGMGGSMPSAPMSAPSGGGMGMPSQPQGAAGLTLANLGGVPRSQGMVMMAAPNGQRQMVRSDQVAHYQQMGAQVVG